MNEFGLFWAMFEQSGPIFFSHILPKILSGQADDAARAGLPIQRSGNIVFIPIKGVMLKSVSWWSYASSMVDITRAVNAAAVDDEVETIVLLMDSPGGSVDGLAALGDAVKAAAQSKTVIAQIDGMCASANYYVASQATKIYAGRNDLIGSIGTRIMLVDTSEYYKEMKVKVIPIDTGEYKSAGAEGTEITKNHIADFQRIVDGFFEDFLTMVQSGRSLTREEILKAADGRVFFPGEAMKLGLIDGVQTLQETISQLRPVKVGRQTQAAKNRLKLI